MGWFSDLFKTAATTAVSPITGVIDAVSSVAGKVLDSNEQKRQFDLALELIKQRPEEFQKELAKSQIETNKVEAASPNPFVAGWRPAVGWVCVICISLFFIPQYLLAAIIWFLACLGYKSIVFAPYPISPTPILELTAIILGTYGAFRTYEKVKGAN